jgi:hypothetical protein
MGNDEKWGMMRRGGDSFQQPLFKNEGLKIPEARNGITGLLSRTSISYLFRVGKSIGRGFGVLLLHVRRV